MKQLVLIIVITCSLFMSGCVTSYMSYKSSKEEINTERILASGDPDAINSLRMGIDSDKIISAVQLNRGAGLKVSLRPGMGEVLAQHGWRQLGAAVLDAGLLYGAYELVDSSHDNDNSVTNDNSSSVTINGDDNVVIEGNNNDSNGDDQVDVNGDENSSNDAG